MHSTRTVPPRPNMFASKMLRVKGRASSAVAVSEENLFSTLPASQKERSQKWQCVMFVCKIMSVTCILT